MPRPSAPTVSSCSAARDPEEAARWYALAAERGNDAAATALGLLYLDGLGVTRDFAKARRLLTGPASRGNSFAKKGLTELQALVAAETDNAPDRQDIHNDAMRRAR